MKIGSNIKSSNDLMLKPGIGIAKLTKVEFIKEMKTKKGLLPCIEFTYTNIPNEKEQEVRTIVDKVFPIAMYLKFDANNPKSVKSFEILAGKLKHVFSTYAELPELDGETYEEIFEEYVTLFNALEDFTTKPVWLITAYSGRFQNVPNSAIRNFIEPYVAGKASNLVLDPNYHKLEPEVISANGAAGAPAIDIPQDLSQIPV
tara:strand:- start:353 stop:958 length:606 start_codon:yes stop_codon:yes gene_type:complete